MHGGNSRRVDSRLGTPKPTRVAIVTTTVSSVLLSLPQLIHYHFTQLATLPHTQ
jgi:hypothetical protein